MRVLSDTPSINTEMKENQDPTIATLLSRHLEFGAEFNADDPADLLTVFVIEPGDTLQTIDAAMNGCFLTNHWSGRRLGDPGFQPCFETLEEHTTVYEMLENRTQKLLLGPLFTEVSSADTTAAGLTQIATQPAYSRAYRLGTRALSTEVEGQGSSDRLHVGPSWGLLHPSPRSGREAVGSDTEPVALAAERCISFALDDGAALELLFQATFPALRPLGKRMGWSLSRERRPGIVLVHTGKSGTKALVLDAK